MYKIILVDDEVLIREAIKENMDWKSLNCQFAGCFQNGVEAITYISEHPVDIVITDICMPFMDGLELSRIIDEEYNNIMILILSGYDNFEYAKQAMKYHVDDYLLKPVAPSELREAIFEFTIKLDKERKKSRNLSQIKQSYNKNKTILRSQTMMNLITGNQSLEGLYHELQEYDIDLSYTHFYIAVIKIWVDTEEKQDGGLAAFIVHNIAEEIIKENKDGEVIKNMDNRLAAVLTTNSPRTFEQNLESLFKKIQYEVKRVMDLELTIGIGGVVTDVDMLHLSYEEAQEMLEYEYSCGRGSILEAAKVRETDSNKDWRLLLEDLFEVLKNGGKGEIHRILKEMSDEIRSAYLKKDRTYFVLLEAIRNVRKSIDAVGMADSEIKQEIHIVEEQVGSAKSLEEAVKVIESLCIKAADEIEIQSDSKGLKRAAMALDYLKKNYMDPSMNLQLVCEYLNMSSSRFSAMFKECTGNTFMEALINIRMEKAKELVVNTSLKNYEIADRVGFSDPHYFSVSFKKATGKTPKEYAREMRGLVEKI